MNLDHFSTSEMADVSGGFPNLQCVTITREIQKCSRFGVEVRGSLGSQRNKLIRQRRTNKWAETNEISLVPKIHWAVLSGFTFQTETTNTNTRVIRMFSGGTGNFNVGMAMFPGWLARADSLKEDCGQMNPDLRYGNKISEQGHISTGICCH